MECNICINKYNKTNNSIIKCYYCNFECCKSCFKTYTFSKMQFSSCMECKNLFSREFLIKNLGVTFFKNKYTCHIKNILFERETEKLQITLGIIEEQKLLNELNYKIHMLNLTENIKMTGQIESTIKETIINEIETIQKKLHSLKKKTNNVFKICLVNNCKGFVIKNICNLCKTEICENCIEIKSKEHVCKKEIVESVNMIKKDSKSCPNCNCIIYKTEGCNNMYCIKCNTFFNWKTLKILAGNIDNPEYYDIIRKKGFLKRNPNDVICGRELDPLFIESLIEKNYNENFVNFLYKTMYLNRTTRQSFLSKINIDNHDIRVKYLKNEIDEDRFKFILQKRNKNSEMSYEIHETLHCYIICLTDILYSYFYDEITFDQMNDNIRYIEKISNNQLKEISKIYFCKKIII